jgi:hypothetical protein
MELVGESYKFDHHFFFEGHYLFYPLAHPHKPCSLYDYAFDFFSRTAAGIARIASGSYQVTLECVVAEVFSFAFEISHAKKARMERGLPFEFDRIYLSSLPYVILLPLPFTRLHPVVA